MTKASCHFIPGFFEPNEKYLVFAIDSKKNFIIKNKKKQINKPYLTRHKT
jgi:hypothetical protein